MSARWVAEFKIGYGRSCAGAVESWAGYLRSWNLAVDVKRVGGAGRCGLE